MKEQLHEISQKSQAESIDLWPEIYEELKESKTMRKPKIHYPLMRFAAVFSLLFVGVLVAYAVSQIYVDSGLEGERAERLVTQVNQSITHGDITVRLDWAYVDVNRMSIGYSVLDENGEIFVPEYPNYSFFGELYLREVVEPTGHGYRPTITGIMDGRWRYEPERGQQIISQAFWLGYEEEIIDAVGELVEVDFRIYSQGQLYRFLTEVPVYPAQFEIEDAVMANDSNEMVLRELTITPSMTTLMYCYILPEELQDNGIGYHGYWEISGMQLYFDDVNVAELFPDADVESYYGYQFMEETCNLIYWAIPTDFLPQRIRFEVGEIRKNENGILSESEADFLIQAYEARGVEIEVYQSEDNQEYGVWFISYYNAKRSREDQAIYNEVMNEFYAAFPEIPRIVGPWTIEFELHDPLN